jgi:hypothetical protein
MSKYLIFVYFISFFLFAAQRNAAPRFNYKTNSCPWLSPFKNASNSKEQKLKKAFLCGDKKGIKRNTLKAYKKLNLYHLFTPSGIHYSCLLILLAPILLLLKKVNKKFETTIKILLYLSPWCLPGFYSLKRIGSMKAIKMVPFFKKIPFVFIFFFYFFIDYFLGTRSYSPMSYNFSFLFIGVILLAHKESYLKLSLYLFIGQMLYACVFKQTVNPLSFIFSFSLTALFSPIFILIMTENFLPKLSYLETMTNFFTRNFNELVQLSFKLISPVGDLIPSIFLILSCYLFIQNKKFSAIFFLLIHSPNTLNLSQSRFRQSFYTYQTTYFINKSQVKKTYYSRGSNVVEFKNNRICRFKTYLYGDKKKCSFKKGAFKKYK